MWPLPLFYIFGQGVNLFFLIFFISTFAAISLAVWLGQERGVPPVIVLDGCLIAIISGLAGTRLLSYLMNSVFPHMHQGYWSIAAIVPLVFFLWVFATLHPTTRRSPLEALDVYFPALALYGALARLGCFSAGCCHGKPAWGLPWAVVFNHPASSSIYRGVPVHPTQLYEAGGCLVILFLLMALRNKPALRGTLIWVYLSAYGLLRFCVEFYRGDVRPMIGLLSLNQVICVAFITIGTVMLARRFAFSDRGFATWELQS